MSNIPPPPERGPRQIRHSTVLVRRAKELVEAGWTTGETARRLAVEFDLDPVPATTTIRRWTEPGYWELHKSWQEKAQRRARGQEPRALRGPLSDDLLMALRVEDELTYSSIAKVARRFFGVDVDPDQLRHRLYELGAPKNPAKSRAVSRSNAERRLAA
jgi:transposase